jgi:protein-L-isoaspartate(D-aspartate) O-methyltransferase
MNDDTSGLHQALVDRLKSDGFITTTPVEAAFRAIPRHLFLPGVALDIVYSDEAIPTKRLDNGQAISSSSQPAIMAIMLEQLGLEPGMRVLEIGAGTGYNAALIATIVGEGGQVVTIDIDEDIVANARAHLAAAGLDHVRVVCGDGGFGYPGAAPYDRIILTVGAWDIAPAWQEQLKPGGRIVLPLSLEGPQVSIALAPADSHLASVSVRFCGFMRLRGALAGPETRIQLGPDPALALDFAREREVDAEAVYTSLTGTSSDWATGIVVTPGEVWEGLSLWLAIREPSLCGLSAEGALAESGIVPFLLGWEGHRTVRFTSGLLEEARLCVLMRPHGQPPARDAPDASPAFELFVRSFGTGDTLERRSSIPPTKTCQVADGGCIASQRPRHRHLTGLGPSPAASTEYLTDALAQRLIEQIAAWDAAGRPDIASLQIRVYPLESTYAPLANEAVIPKRWTRLVLSFEF